MTVTIAGRIARDSRIEVVTQQHVARAWIDTPATTAASVGDPVAILTADGAPVLTAEVIRVERIQRHRRIVARPPALADMDRRTVGPETLTAATVPDVLAAVMGAHLVAALPPLDTARLALWSTRERTQLWCLESVLRALRHDGQPCDWRFDARGNRVVLHAPGDDAERVEHEARDALRARGGTVELSAVRYAVQAGDTLNGDLVKMAKVCWSSSIKRVSIWT